MGDYDKYLAQLQGQASNNIYNKLGGVADSLSGSVLQYSQQPDADLGESLLYGSILGLLGGGLGSMGQSYTDDQIGLASQVLTGRTREQPEGLSPSLYKQARSYKDVVEANRLQERLGKINERIDEKDIDLDYIGKEYRAQEAAKRGSLIPGGIDGGDKGRVSIGAGGEKGGVGGIASGTDSEAIPQMSKYLPLVERNVPSQLQAEAVKELGTMDTVQKAFQSVDRNIDMAYENSTWTGTLDPTGLVPSTSEEAQMYDTATANITADVIKIWKGPLDENDARRIIEPYVPNKWDTDKTLAAKKNGLMNLLVGNAKESPILEQYGIRNRPDPNAISGNRPVIGTSLSPQDAQEFRAFAADAKAKGFDNATIKQRWGLYKSGGSLG